MNLKSTRKILIIGCAGVGIASCSASKRVARIIERSPELVEETQIVVIQDTFRDTIHIEHELQPIDSILEIKENDTFSYENEEIVLTIARAENDEFWLNYLPKTIVIDSVIEKPIYLEKEIPKVIYRKARDALSWKLISIGLFIILIIISINKLKRSAK